MAILVYLWPCSPFNVLKSKSLRWTRTQFRKANVRSGTTEQTGGFLNQFQTVAAVRCLVPSGGMPERRCSQVISLTSVHTIVCKLKN